MLIGEYLGKYQARLLTREDVPAVVQLCRGNPQYYLHCPPQATEETILSDMAALPPRKTAEDKFYLGLYQGDALAAVIDLVQKCPTETAVFLGFFMLRSDLQGRGEGSAIIEECCRRFREAGFTLVRLGYVQGNEQSRRFWVKNGFSPTGRMNQLPQYNVVLMERLLK